MRLAFALLLSFLPATAVAQSRQEVLDTMKKATTFFSTKASIRGGYVWNISEDFKRHYGEIPARMSQIWVQSATPMVGMAMLDAFESTGDKIYLDVAEKAGLALAWGQRPGGGWHYMIDFEPRGVQEWYRDHASKFKWGMEEQRFFNGNATFDDGNSQSATRFLLRLYLVRKDPRFKAPLLKALNFILRAQYPNGAFPQRFPLHYDFIHDGFPDYTPYYTLNDGAMVATVRVLVDAYENLGDKRYLESARRAVDFFIAVQGPEDQAAWAEQYHPDTMRPEKARTHEPAGFVIRESEQVIETLETFYKMTGDRRYLRPIPGCLAWFDRVNNEALELKRVPARYYEPGTNLPIYVLRTDRTNAEGYGLYRWSTSEPQGNMQGLSSFGNIAPAAREVVNVKPLRAEYERIAKLDAKVARAEYERERSWTERSGFDPRWLSEALRTIDERGAWVTNCRVLRLDAPTPNGMNSGDFEMIRGYSTGVFVRNVAMMTAFLKTRQQ